MESQLYAGGVEAWVMPWGRALRIERLAGEFRVLHGRVWLTRRGDPDDHVLQAGQCVALRADDKVVVEPWQAGERTVVQWQPSTQVRRVEALPREAAAFALGGVARFARGAAGAFDALARSAAAMARRAQGCICAGDSIASAGALQ